MRRNRMMMLAGLIGGWTLMACGDSSPDDLNNNLLPDPPSPAQIDEAGGHHVRAVFSRNLVYGQVTLYIDDHDPVTIPLL